MNIRIAAASAGTALALLAAPVSAATITGETVSIYQLFPDITSPYLEIEGSVEVGAGVEATLTSGGANATIDVSGSSVTVTALEDFPISGSGSFNGIRITDVLGGFGDFMSFSLAGDPTIEGAVLSFDADSLYLNFDATGYVLEGQSLTANFTVADPAPVPLPAAGVMLFAGAGLLGFVGRRRRRRS